jgi:uncharacterized damage-inducible protein DinB
MVWTAPEVTRVDGSLVAPESETLRGVLDFHRGTLLAKCAGLSGADLARAPIAQSNLTLSGLIRHLSKVERVWFRERFRAEPIERLYSTPERPDADFEDVDAAHAEEEYARLLTEQELARRAVADASMDETFIHPDGSEMSLRMVFVHMIGEYARHNGHADMVRQCIDGVTGD